MNLAWEGDTMLFEPSQSFVHLGDVLEKRLSTATTLVLEVVGEINRQFSLRIVLERGIEQGQELLKGVGFFGLVEIKVLDQFPCRVYEASHQVEHRFTLTFGNGHLPVINGDALSPFLVG